MVRYKWYIVPAEPCSGQSGHAPSGRADRILYLWEDIAMTITKNEAGGALRIALTGRLDTNTAPQLETELKASLSGVTELDLDFSGLEYISSAGLRVLLAAQKAMNKQGKMTLRNVSESIMEVFEITGFVDILSIV